MRCEMGVLVCGLGEADLEDNGVISSLVIKCCRRVFFVIDLY